MKKTKNPLKVLLVGLVISFLAVLVLGMLGDIIGSHTMFVIGGAFVLLAGIYVILIQLSGRSKEESRLQYPKPPDEEVVAVNRSREQMDKMDLKELMRDFPYYES